MTYDEYVNIVYSHNFFKFKEGALVSKRDGGRGVV